MQFQLGTFMYKLKYNKLPSLIPNMFITNENIHSHNTRNKNGYLIPSVRTNCRKFTVSYAGPILWNSFPHQLRQLPSVRPADQISVMSGFEIVSYSHSKPKYGVDIQFPFFTEMKCLAFYLPVYLHAYVINMSKYVF